MSIDLAAILKAIEAISAAYSQIETAIQSEADLKRRKRLFDLLQAIMAKAKEGLDCKEELDELRKMYFEN
jgi:hypothetical protein